MLKRSAALALLILATSTLRAQLALNDGLPALDAPQQKPAPVASARVFYYWRRTRAPFLDRRNAAPAPQLRTGLRLFSTFSDIRLRQHRVK